MADEGRVVTEHPPTPLFDVGELRLWSFYRALISEFVATLLFLYVLVATVIGHKAQSLDDQCGGCAGAISGVGIARSIMKHQFDTFGGGTNVVALCYSDGAALGAEIIGTFVLVYTVFTATDPKRNARDSHVPVLAPLSIGFAVFLVHLATIPITGTGINPARSLGAAVIYNKRKPWNDQVSWYRKISYKM
ncbi:hypothetical protein B296_00039196 [Ensete ventricosum]|uniref:Aquaporin n=1 Tax=Ensete ventricosum TaxID=4639 RepID=A0A426XDV3_ENSVE|nr:hypothetical protein B296_00039196 [Ensete ventricosum]